MTKFWLSAVLFAVIFISTNAYAQEEAAKAEPVEAVTDDAAQEPAKTEKYVTIVDEPADTTDGQREFALNFAAASRAGDVNNLWALVHPASRACLTDAEKAFIEQENYAYLIEEPIQSVKMTQVNKVLDSDVKSLFGALYGESVTLPVMPTHSLQIHYERENGACAPVAATRFVYVAEVEADAWREVMPCNTTFPVTAEQAAEFKAAHEAEIDTVFKALDAETKTRFRNEVRSGELVKVTKEIAALTNRDLSLSRGVAQKFCHE